MRQTFNSMIQRHLDVEETSRGLELLNRLRGSSRENLYTLQQEFLQSAPLFLDKRAFEIVEQMRTGNSLVRVLQGLQPPPEFKDDALLGTAAVYLHMKDSSVLPHLSRFMSGVTPDDIRTIKKKLPRYLAPKYSKPVALWLADNILCLDADASVVACTLSSPFICSTGVDYHEQEKVSSLPLLTTCMTTIVVDTHAVRGPNGGRLERVPSTGLLADLIRPLRSL